MNLDHDPSANVHPSSSLFSRLIRHTKSCEFYEPFITIGGPLLTMLICEWNGRSEIFGVIICCLIQERYVFLNLSTKSVMSIKVAMEAFAFLSNLLGFVLIGYKLYRSFAVFFNIWKFVLMVLLVSYFVRLVIISPQLNVTFPINTLHFISWNVDLHVFLELLCQVFILIDHTEYFVLAVY